MTPETTNLVSLPVLPLKNSVLFPHLFMPLSVGRANSMAAVDAALSGEDKALVLIAQKDASNANKARQEISVQLLASKAAFVQAGETQLPLGVLLANPLGVRSHRSSPLTGTSTRRAEVIRAGPPGALSRLS